MDSQFNTFDIVGGDGTLSGYGFPEVHKFDGKNFYNWEEDNLPVLDLKERSNVLRQYLGVGSTPEGVTLTVSATADINASSTGVFRTIQDALSIVPRRLTFPLLIEICDFGDLGDLVLSDIQCEGEGALQIVCRQFGFDPSGKAYVGIETPLSDDFPVVSVSSFSGWGPSATQTMPCSVSANDLKSALYEVSSSHLEVNCSSLTEWDSHGRVFTQKKPNSQNETQTIAFTPFPRGTQQATYGHYEQNYPWSFFQRTYTQGSWTAGGGYVAPLFTGSFAVNPYSKFDEVTVSGDPNPRTRGGAGNNLLEQRLPLEKEDAVGIMAYGAYFRQVKIRNCHNVKLQNICVDSASGSDAGYMCDGPVQYLCDTGIDVLNSNIVLENVSTARFNKTGIKAQNSSINVAKGFNVYRVYERDVDQVRGANGVGVYLVDSTLAFDDTPTSESGGYINTIAKTGIGVYAINSIVCGGAKSDQTSQPEVSKNAGQFDNRTTSLYINNNETGVKLDRSTLTYDGRLEVFCNIVGLDALESSITLVQFSVDDNENEGFMLNKSVLTYGKDADYFVSGDMGGVSATTGAPKPKGAFTSDYNGTNVYATKGSSVIPSPGCSALPNMDIWGGSWSGTGANSIGKLAMASHGVVDPSSNTPTPALLITDNSNAEFVNLGFAGDGQKGFVGGSCARADKNSNIVFRGTRKSTTAIGSYGSLTTTALRSNWTTAAVCANSNSKVTFTGPTKISRFGICVLAEDNSTMSFQPPSEGDFNWLPNSTKYGLGNANNQTKLDLHSTRACLVANNKSTIKMQALGGSAINASATVDAYALSGGILYDTIFCATRHSFVRFMPNGFTENAANQLETEGTYLDIFGRKTMALSYDNLQWAGTTGGMCVRAVGGSDVNVNMVDFKCALDANVVSGVAYNYFGTGCEFTDDTSGGCTPSPLSNLCDLVSECCDPSSTTVTQTTTATTTTSTTATTTTSTTSTTTTSTTTTSTTTTSTTTTSTTTTSTTTTSTTTTSTTTTSTTTTGTTTTEVTSTVTTVTLTTPSTPIEMLGAPPPPRVSIFDRGIYSNAQGDPGAGSNANYSDPNLDTQCFGSRIHMWNIADTSRVHAANLLINGLDPSAACITNSWHGPTGRWNNGAACDYYGKYGIGAEALSADASMPKTSDGFMNLGIFRLLGSHRGYLKMYGEVDYAGSPLVTQYYGGGSPMDQIGCQGYQTMFDNAIAVSGVTDPTKHIGLEGGASPGAEPVFGRGLAGTPGNPGKINGMVTHAPMVEGYGMIWDLGQLHPQFPIPPLHLGWQGYIRNWVDESAASVFANARHAASKKVNLLSIYRSNTLGLRGGEGRDSTIAESPTYGVGVKSLNLFDLDRLV